MLDRITEKTIGCFGYDPKDFKHKPKEFNEYDVFYAYSMAVKRLGEYEDTGLTPEEINDHEETFKAYKSVCGGYSPEQIAEFILLRGKIERGELVEVVKGEWESIPLNVYDDRYGMNKYNMRIKCSSCGFVTASDLKYKFCPCCGADMRGERSVDNE